MAVSGKIREFMERGSWIRKMFEEGIVLKAQYGEDNVFDLSLGNPIMEPPPQFFEELRRIANSSETGMHRYMPNAGYPDARAAVAVGLARETGMPISGDHVVLTCGAGGALNVIMKTLLDPGDEVVICAPYFVEFARDIFRREPTVSAFYGCDYLSPLARNSETGVVQGGDGVRL